MTEEQMQSAEKIQKECHSIVSEMMAKDKTLSYQDCTNVFLFTQLATLTTLQAKVKYLEKAVDDYANDIVKKNETIGELRRASSPIECYPRWVKASENMPTKKGTKNYFIRRYETKNICVLRDGEFIDVISLLPIKGAVEAIEWLDESAAALPLPVESGWIKELDEKFSHCFFGQNTSFNELVEFIKTKIK